MTAPPGETAKERRRQWYVGIAAVLALVGVVGTVALGIVLVQTTNSHDDTITAQAAVIVARDAKIISLENQHGADIKNEAQLLVGIASADKVLNQAGIDLFLESGAACANSVSIAEQLHLQNVACPTIHPLPALSSPTTTTTTTTQPHHSQ